MSTIFGKQKSPSVITAPVYEGHDVQDHGDLLAIQESYDDQFSIIRHIHAIDSELLVLESDVSALQDGGASEYEVEQHLENVESVMEASVKGAWEGIKTFFRNLWGKLTAFFNTVVRYFDGQFRSAQGFVKKYETQLKRLVLDGYEFKMHEYTHLELVTKAKAAAEVKGVKEIYTTVFNTAIVNNDKDIASLKTIIESSKDAKEDTLNAVRGETVGKGPLTPDNFKQELFSYFRDGAKNHEDTKERPVDISKIMDAIKNTSAKQRIEEFSKETNKEFADVLKRIEALSKAVENATDTTRSHTTGEDGTRTTTNTHHTDVDSPTSGATTRRIHYNANNRGTIIEGIRTISTFLTSIKDIELQLFRSWREAWAERDRTYRSVCISAFSYKKKAAN